MACGGASKQQGRGVFFLLDTLSNLFLGTFPTQGEGWLALYTSQSLIYLFFACLLLAVCSRHTEFPKMKVLIQESLAGPPATSIPLLFPSHPKGEERFG